MLRRERKLSRGMQMQKFSIKLFKQILLFLLRSALVFTKYLCETMANIKATIFANNMRTPSGFSSVKQEPTVEGTNLLVNYLPFDLQENELYMLFIGFGKLEHVKIIRDAMTGNSQCYGFVKYRNSKDAEMALSLMNGRHVHGKKLKVSLARPSLEEMKYTNIYVANLPVDYDAARVREIFERFGKILDLKLLKDRYTRQSRGIAFVRYDLRASVDQAVMALNGFRLEIGHPPLQVRDARRPKDFEFPNAMFPGHGLPVVQASTDTSMESLKQEIKMDHSEVDSPTDPSKFPQSISCNSITSSLRRSLNNTLMKFNVSNGRKIDIPALPMKTEPAKLGVPKEISPKLASDCSICLSQSGFSGKRFETAKSLQKKQFRRAKFYSACKPKQSDTK